MGAAVFGKVVPARNAVSVTPSDSVNLAQTTRAIYIGASGNVSVEMEGLGTAVVFVGVQTGEILAIAVTRINSTSTTATSIVALY